MPLYYYGIGTSEMKNFTSGIQFMSELIGYLVLLEFNSIWLFFFRRLIQKHNQHSLSCTLSDVKGYGRN